jgi:hypothetical protein
MPEQELTRRAMYDLVWSRPMTKVAEDLGISDVALKKICEKHRVPTPPRGYWAKRDAGKPTKQVQFHSTSDPQHEHIVIHGSRNNLAPEIREVLKQERQRRKSKPKAALPAEVAQEVLPQDVHPSISATAKALRKAKPDADEVVGASGHGCCGIEVGAASLERTIAVLDSIARALDARGLKVEPIGNCMRVALPPDSLTFSLVERIEKRKHVPTMEELAKEERLRKKQERNNRLGMWSFNRERAYSEFDFIRTGKLSIQIADQYVRGLRRSWGDGKRQKVEGLVDDIVSGMVTYLAGAKARREERERWQRDWDRRQRLAALARAREERESRRCEFLKRFVALSTEADELKSFLGRLRERMPACPSGELARMTEWTESRLQRLEDELTPEGIATALQERELFPEIDQLSDIQITIENDPS